jgi:predicted transposase/invertase (TIGR01784 family)
MRWENLTLANDFMFSKVMCDAELCTEMIRRILPDMDIGHIKFIESQKSEKHSIDTRGVRFDVYAKSDNRKIFDCEVQTSDKKDLPRRTRAYHIMLGLEALKKDTLNKSGMYNEMPDTFVIFLCTFDPFSLGRHIYSFCNICKEDNALKLNDGAVTIFLNAKGRADDVNGELKAFLDFMLGKSCNDPFIMRLEERLNELKQKTEWRRNYMLLLTREEEALIEGRNEGRIEGRIEGRNEGIALGKELGRSETLNSAIEAMKLNGISNEQIDNIRNAVLKS